MTDTDTGEALAICARVDRALAEFRPLAMFDIGTRLAATQPRLASAMFNLGDAARDIAYLYDIGQIDPKEDAR